MNLELLEQPTLDLAATGESILGTGTLAAKTVATWLPAPVESVKRGGVWVHHRLGIRTGGAR